MNPEKCVILCPAYGQIEPETERGFQALANAGYKVTVLRGGSSIDLARSMMATDALAEGFEETFWIDSDTVFTLADVEQIRNLNLPFCCGLYAKKDASGFAAKFYGPKVDVLLGKGAGVIPMEGVGFGFAHVRREVYEAIGKTLPVCSGAYQGKDVVPYFLPVIHTVPEEQACYYLGEDTSFCVKARAAGYEVMADLSIKLGHVGKKIYTWDDFQETVKYESVRFAIVPPGTEPDREPVDHLYAESPEEEQPTMNEAKLYEKIGRLQSDLDAMNANYDQLLAVLANVASGATDPERVSVDLAARSWAVAAEDKRQTAPKHTPEAFKALSEATTWLPSGCGKTDIRSPAVIEG